MLVLRLRLLKASFVAYRFPLPMIFEQTTRSFRTKIIYATEALDLYLQFLLPYRIVEATYKESNAAWLRTQR